MTTRCKLNAVLLLFRPTFSINSLATSPFPPPTLSSTFVLISWLAIIHVSSSKVATSGANFWRSTTIEERPFSAKVIGSRVIQLLRYVRTSILMSKVFCEGNIERNGRNDEPTTDEARARLCFAYCGYPFAQLLKLSVRLGGRGCHPCDFPGVDIPFGPLNVATWLWKSKVP